MGAVLSIVGLTSVVWGLIEASERGWTDSTILGAFALGGAVIAAFLAWERKVEQPMLEIEIFRNLRFSAASLSVMLVFFGLMGTDLHADDVPADRARLQRARRRSFGCSRSPSA